MKQPSQKEINDSTFKMDSEKHYSYGTERRFRICASRVLDGMDIETACRKDFGRVSDQIMEEVRDFVGKISRETDDREYVSDHRSNRKTAVLGKMDQPTSSKTSKDRNISRRVRNDQ